MKNFDFLYRMQAEAYENKTDKELEHMAALDEFEKAEEHDVEITKRLIKAKSAADKACERWLAITEVIAIAKAEGVI